MRYIFVDEAGTSAREPVTIVVGIIADADLHIMAAETALAEAIGSVPTQYQDGFIFHATDVFSNESIRDGWSLTDRVNLLKTVMSIPRRLEMAISIGVQWRRSSESALYSELGISPEQGDHLYAFQQCLAMADRNIRQHANPREVATVIAENVEEMRRFLKTVPSVLRDNPTTLPPDMIRRTAREEQAGYIAQGNDIRITRIRRAIHFVEKSDEPLVQLADACAFGFRRYFAKQSFGEDFARAILGDEKLLADFATPGGAQCFWPVNQMDPSYRASS